MESRCRNTIARSAPGKVGCVLEMPRSGSSGTAKKTSSAATPAHSSQPVEGTRVSYTMCCGKAPDEIIAAQRRMRQQPPGKPTRECDSIYRR